MNYITLDSCHFASQTCNYWINLPLKSVFVPNIQFIVSRGPHEMQSRESYGLIMKKFTNFVWLLDYVFVNMEASEPKWVNPLLDIIGVNSLWHGRLHIVYAVYTITLLIKALLRPRKIMKQVTLTLK